MTDVNQTVDTVERLAESAIPGAALFHPIIALVTTAIVAHFRATGTFPTEAQVLAALPADYQKLVDGWGSWSMSNDGTLPK